MPDIEWLHGYDEAEVQANPIRFNSGEVGIGGARNSIPIRANESFNVTVGNTSYVNGSLAADILFEWAAYSENIYLGSRAESSPVQEESKIFGATRVGDELDFAGYKIRVVMIRHAPDENGGSGALWELEKYPEDAEYFLPGRPDTDPTA